MITLGLLVMMVAALLWVAYRLWKQAHADDSWDWREDWQ